MSRTTVGFCCAAASVAGVFAALGRVQPAPDPQQLRQQRQLQQRAKAMVAANRAANSTAATGRVILGSAGWTTPTAPTPHAFSTAWCLMPHPEKRHKGGEDAAFGSDSAIGVADGVGGWASRGVDPGLYSKALMQSADEKARANPQPGTPTPVEILRSAYDVVQGQKIMGSTTAIVATLESASRTAASIHTANLGDSGVLVLRPVAGQTCVKLFRSVEQQHSFNFPFQLSCDTGNANPDLPEHADVHKLEVTQDDLVILGTDGLFDNLFDAEIVAIVDAHSKQAGGANFHSEEVLQKMAQAVRAQRNPHRSFRGGVSERLRVLTGRGGDIHAGGRPGRGHAVRSGRQGLRSRRLQRGQDGRYHGAYSKGPAAQKYPGKAVGLAAERAAMGEATVFSPPNLP